MLPVYSVYNYKPIKTKPVEYKHVVESFPNNFNQSFDSKKMPVIDTNLLYFKGVEVGRQSCSFKTK